MGGDTLVERQWQPFSVVRPAFRLSSVSSHKRKRKRKRQQRFQRESGSVGVVPSRIPFFSTLSKQWSRRPSNLHWCLFLSFSLFRLPLSLGVMSVSSFDFVTTGRLRCLSGTGTGPGPLDTGSSRHGSTSVRSVWFHLLIHPVNDFRTGHFCLIVSNQYSLSIIRQECNEIS